MPPAPGEAPVPPVPDGQAQYEKLLNDPRGGQQVATIWKQQTTQQLRSGGMTPSAIAAYMGDTAPALPSIQNAADRANYVNSGIAPGTPVAQNAAEELQAGWEKTAVGRIFNQVINGGNGDPNVQTNPKSTLLGSLANVAGGTLGDLGPSIAGAVGGGSAAAGAGAETGPGDIPIALLGAGAGGSALPTALTHAVIDAQHQGKDISVGDVVSQTWDVVRDGVIGAATLGLGHKVGGAVLDKTGSKLASVASDLGSQATSQAVLGAAAQGRIPTKQDFISAIAGTLGTHVAFLAPGKLSSAGLRLQRNMQEVFKQSNGRLTPDLVAKAMQQDPAIRQEMLQQDIHGDPVTPMLTRASGDPISFLGKPTKPDHPVSAQPDFRAGVTGLLGVIGGNETGSGDATARNAAVSPKGAQGMFQVEPGTARQYGFDPTQLHDQAYNTHVAQVIISDLYRKSGGDEAAVLVGYDAGPGRMHEYLNAGPGTRLEAVRDPSQHGGWRYEKVSAARDESHLPLETQKYVAQGRTRMAEKGGKPFSDADGATSGDVSSDQTALLNEKATEEEAAAHNDADKEVSDAGAAVSQSPSDGDQASALPIRMDTDKAHEIMSGSIAPEQKESVVGGLLKLMSPTRLYSQFVSELGNARHIDGILAEHEGAPDAKTGLTLEDTVRNSYASEQRAVTILRPHLIDAMSQAKKAGGDENGWRNWMMASRAEDKRLQGIDVFGADVDKKAAAFSLATDPKEVAKYSEATQTLQKGWDEVLDYGLERGLWTPERVNAMREQNPVWLAMQRDLSSASSTGKKSGGVGASDPLRKLQGSDAQVVNPLLSSFNSSVRVIAQADQNSVAKFIADAANRGALGDLVTKVATLDKMKVLTPKVNEDTGENELNPEFGFVPHKLAPNEFSLLDNGKREIYAVNDTKSIDGSVMAQMVRGADTPGQANILFKTAELMSRLERQGIIGNPTFPIHVQLLHIVQAFITDPAHPFPFLNMAQGTKDALSMGTRSETPTLREWLMNGGGGAEMVQMDVHALDKNITDVLGETGLQERFNAMNPLAAFRAVSLRMGVASRIGYYKARVAEGVDPVKAAMMSRSAFVDYSEHGTLEAVRQWSKIVPFMRPGILIADNVARAVKSRPVSTSLYALAALTAPTIALQVINRLQDQYLPEDEKFANIPAYEKDTSLVLPSVAGWRGRIPLPKQLGYAFAGLPNRIFDASNGSDPKFREWAAGFLQSWMPPVSPTIATPIAENTLNQNFFTGRPLISGSLEKLSGPMQYTDSTSYTARKLDRVLGPAWAAATGKELSPIQIDNLVKEWGGVWGPGTLAALDVPMRAADKEMTPPDHGVFNKEASIFVGTFMVQNQGANAASVSEFYDRYKSFETASADKAAAIERASNGQPEEMMEMMQAAKDPEAYVKLSEVTDAMRMARMAVNEIGVRKDITVDEKRQRIEKIYGEMIEMSKAGLTAIDAVEKMQDKPKEASHPLNVGAMQQTPSLIDQVSAQQ